MKMSGGIGQASQGIHAKWALSEMTRGAQYTASHQKKGISPQSHRVPEMF